MTLALQSSTGSAKADRGLIGQIVLAVLGGMSIGVATAFALDAIESTPARSETRTTEPVRASPSEFVRPMRFSLGENGVLTAQGSIEPGTAAKLALELQAHGADVETLSLDSPGGSLTEAMAMGEQVRAYGIATMVADGAICASSCPLLFAGGIERGAGPRAAIGVHQFYASPTPGLRGSIDAMSDAQLVTARISRYLAEMDVDPTVWLHALDTPPTTLYYFSGSELAQYRLTTAPSSTPTGHTLGQLIRYFGII